MGEGSGVSAGRAKGCAVDAGDHEREAVGHSAKCWERIEDLVKKDTVLRDRFEVAEGRRCRKEAEYIEEGEGEAADGGGVARALCAERFALCQFLCVRCGPAWRQIEQSEGCKRGSVKTLLCQCRCVRCGPD